MQRRTSLLALALALAGSASTLAQDPPAKPAQTPPSEPAPISLAKALEGLAPADLWYGAYMGKKNVAWYHIQARAREGGGTRCLLTGGTPEGTGRSDASIEWNVGTDGSTLNVSMKFDNEASCGSLTLVREKDGRAPRTYERIARQPDPETGKVPAPIVRSDAIEIPPATAPDGLLNVLLARLTWETGVPRRVWAFGEDGKPAPVTATLTGTANVRIRNVTRSVGLLRLVEPRKPEAEEPDPDTIVWIADGRALGWKPEGTSFSVILGTPDEVRRELAPPTPDELAAQRNACQFMRATALGEDGLFFDATDLGAVQERWGRFREDIRRLSPTGFRQCLADWLEKSRGRGEAYLAEQRKILEGLDQTLDVEVTGERAVANVGGKGQAIHLAKRDGKWRVVWWEVIEGWR